MPSLRSSRRATQTIVRASVTMRSYDLHGQSEMSDIYLM